MAELYYDDEGSWEPFNDTYTDEDGHFTIGRLVPGEAESRPAGCANHSSPTSSHFNMIENINPTFPKCPQNIHVRVCADLSSVPYLANSYEHTYI